MIQSPIAMCLFGLIGIAGIYARQVEKVGWLGLAGYLAFSLFLLVTIACTFAEAFISPVLVTESPGYVEGFLGIVSGGGGAPSRTIAPACASARAASRTARSISGCGPSFPSVIWTVTRSPRRST